MPKMRRQSAKTKQLMAKERRRMKRNAQIHAYSSVTKDDLKKFDQKAPKDCEFNETVDEKSRNRASQLQSQVSDIATLSLKDELEETGQDAFKVCESIETIHEESRHGASSMPNTEIHKEEQAVEDGIHNMVKRTAPPSSRKLRNAASLVYVQLMMECVEEPLTQCQLVRYKEQIAECQKAQAKVKEAHALARQGKAVVTVLDDPRKSIPPLTPQQLMPQPQKTTSDARSSSPDIIFIGESPPKPKPTTPSPQQNKIRVPNVPPMPTAPVTQNIQNRQVLQIVPSTTSMRQIQPNAPGLQRFPGYPNQHVQIQGSQMRTVPSRFVQMQSTSGVTVYPTTSQTYAGPTTPVAGTFGMGIKRGMPQDDAAAKKKKLESENTVPSNWVPLDEYYYGKMEGDPTYCEEKNEFRFKCWYCNKMLYNNIKAMMHIQGHIDSSKQQNIDLSDLTQCKHCYKQFDTPFEMQTHVEKVHMNNVNVLLCRICEKDHTSRQALASHMRSYHNACEMPYICQLCKFRSSMYSDVVDHFKKKHDSSQHILCLYCLRVFNVKFVSQGWGQTQTYYGHLLKHQSKSSSKKCQWCRLTFVNPVDCKQHKKKDHGPNQKGIDSRHSSYGQDMMIKVPESGATSKLKSLNAPAVSKVLDFGGTRFPYTVNYHSCVECKTIMGTPDHFRKHIECTMCRFATSCSIAYANHMMGFHSGQMTSLNLNIPWEQPMKEAMYCLCGFSSRYGNKIANHLVYCTKRSCYKTRQAAIVEEEDTEERDPRHKPGASLLDVLGLVKKKSVATKVRRRSSEESTELVWKSSSEVPMPSEPDTEKESDGIPKELKGAEKWKTVKIKETSTPSKMSVFLGEEPLVSNDEPSKEQGLSRNEEKGTPNNDSKSPQNTTSVPENIKKEISQEPSGNDGHQISESTVKCEEKKEGDSKAVEKLDISDKDTKQLTLTSGEEDQAPVSEKESVSGSQEKKCEPDCEINESLSTKEDKNIAMEGICVSEKEKVSGENENICSSAEIKKEEPNPDISDSAESKEDTLESMETNEAMENELLKLDESEKEVSDSIKLSEKHIDSSDQMLDDSLLEDVGPEETKSDQNVVANQESLDASVKEGDELSGNEESTSADNAAVEEGYSKNKDKVEEMDENEDSDVKSSVFMEKGMEEKDNKKDKDEMEPQEEDTSNQDVDDSEKVTDSVSKGKEEEERQETDDKKDECEKVEDKIEETKEESVSLGEKERNVQPSMTEDEMKDEGATKEKNEDLTVEDSHVPGSGTQDSQKASSSQDVVTSSEGEKHTSDPSSSSPHEPQNRDHHSGSRHHYDDRSHGHRQHHDRDRDYHRSPGYSRDRYDQPHHRDSWSRHGDSRHHYDDRSTYRHDGHNRNYDDRNRYYDNRNYHDDRRHGGYHDNRSGRGQWSHGNYRGRY